MIVLARVNSATLLSAKVNHLIKCTFYKNTPLERPKQETIRILVINFVPCCNFTVNFCCAAAHEEHKRCETSIAFFSDSPLTEMNHFCSQRLSCAPSALSSVSADFFYLATQVVQTVALLSYVVRLFVCLSVRLWL